MIHKNVVTDFSAKACDPQIDPTAFVHPLAAVIGNVILGKRVMVSPFAAIRGDEGQPLYVGDESNVHPALFRDARRQTPHGLPAGRGGRLRAQAGQADRGRLCRDCRGPQQALRAASRCQQ